MARYLFSEFADQEQTYSKEDRKLTGWIDLTIDSNRMAKLIETLEESYRNAKDEQTKLNYLDRLFIAQDLKQKIDSIIKKNSLF